MKTPIQQLIDKYNHHLENDSDLDSISGRDILKVVIVDLISQQVKEKEQYAETWDAAIKSHEDRGYNYSRSWSDFDEYWYKLNKKL